MSLNLVPNEFVGYRIKPDWYSFNVVLVKRHGAASKNAGKEYETTVAYCKNLAFATSWIVAHSARVRGELSQKEQESLDGTVASVEALRDTFEAAKQDALRAVEELQNRLNAAGLSTLKSVVKALGDTPEPAGESEQN